MENIAQIQPFQKLVSWNQFLDRRSILDRRSRFKKQRKITSRSYKRKLYTLTQMADDTHQTLVRTNAPLRLCVYQNEGDLVLDVVAIDTDNNENHHFRREITDAKLSDLIRQIHKQQGLILDYSL